MLPISRSVKSHLLAAKMGACVYFKFKSQKEPTRVEFDGTVITVFELKREIILRSGLGSGTDFDLAIYPEGGGDGKLRLLLKLTTTAAMTLIIPKLRV